MDKQTQLKNAVQTMDGNSPVAPVQADAYATIYLAEDDVTIRLEAAECAVVFGSPEGIDLLSDNLEVGEEDVISYAGVYISEEVLSALEMLFSQIEEI